MPSYEDKYVIDLSYIGQDAVQRFGGDVSKVRDYLEGLSKLAGPTANALGSLDSHMRISDTTLQSYDRLLRYQTQLYAAQQRLKDVQATASVPVGTKGGFPNEYVRNAAVATATAGVDARAEALSKEVQRQIAASQSRQAASAKDAASAQSAVAKADQEQARSAEQFSQRMLQFNNQLYSTLQQRKAAAEAATAAEKQIAEQAQKQAVQARGVAVDQALAARSPALQYPGADLATHVGRAQSGVDQASAGLQVATLKLAQERESDARTVASVIAAENRVAAASSRYALAQENLRRLQTRTGGSLADQFRLGFRGTNEDRSYAEQVGQAFKFSVFYGTAYKLLFGITQTLQATLQEGVAFQQAMTELNVAAGRPKDELNGLAQQLGSSAVQAGFAPSQGILVGARSLGLFGAAAGSGASAAQQDQIAEISSRVVSRIALGSGLQPVDIQTNLAAIAQAFGTGAEGQVRAYDLDAYLSRKFGVAPGSTLAPVSESATVGAAAGFTQEQITSIAADLMARTGTTPETVAGYMAQIFSRSGEGALTGVEQKYGVDTTGNLNAQFAQLAKVYANQPGARDEISAAFGRGKVQNAVIALLQDYPDVQKQAAGAVTGAAGQGDAQYKLRLDNLGGQLNITAGIFKDFADQLGQSGLLTDLGAVLVVIRNITQAGTELLREWNALPGVIKATAVALAGLAISAKVAGVGGIAGRLGLGVAAEDAAGASLSRSATAGFLNGRYYSAGTRLISPTFTNVGASEVGAAVPLASTAGAATLGRNALNSLGGFGVAAAVLGDVYLWGGLASATRKLANAQNQASGALNDTLGPNATSAQLQAHAANLTQVASQNRDAEGGLLAFITGGKYGLGPNRSDLSTQASQADAEAKRLTALAAASDKFQAAIPATDKLITSLDPQEFATSMDAITASGGNARDRLAALNDTLLGTAGAARRAQASFDPSLFAGGAAETLQNTLLGTGYLGRTTPKGLFGGIRDLAGVTIPSLRAPNETTNVLPDYLRKVLPPDVLQSRLTQALRQRGITSLSDISRTKAGGLATDVVGDAATQVLKDAGITDPKQVEYLRELYVKSLTQKILDIAHGTKTAVHGNTRISQTQLTTAINQVTSDTSDLLNTLPQGDYAGRLRVLNSQVSKIIAYANHTKGGITDDGQDKLDAAERAVAQEQIARLEALRKTAQHGASGQSQIKSIGRSFFAREVAAAVRGGDTDSLATLVSNAGDWGVAIARQQIENALKIARAAAAAESQMATFAASEIAGIRGMIGRPGGPSGASQAQQHRIDQLTGLLHSLNFDTPSGKNNAYDTGSDANLSAAQTETALQKQAAAASANATRSESQISQARAALLSARADMAQATKGSVEYYQALGAYYDAQNQLTDAIQAYRTNQYLLGHDETNPLVQARAQLLAAQAKLRSDAGKPGDVTAADRVAVRQAQASVESTAFQQRLDAVQTAESLGRISYSAYINYLDHERDRLRNISHRSYQQQQELNQVDQLLKTAADQMQGQWNFGDIKLPTPYQVRRAIEERSGNDIGGSHGVGGAGANTVNHNTRIVIDGADTGQIVRILRQYLGAPGRTRTTGTRHR